MPHGKKSLTIQMPNGTTWAVPAYFIATDRASALTTDRDGEDFWNSVYKETLEDEVKLLEWARESMEWNDLKHLVELVDQSCYPDYESWYPDATFKVVERDDLE